MIRDVTMPEVSLKDQSAIIKTSISILHDVLEPILKKHQQYSEFEKTCHATFLIVTSKIIKELFERRFSPDAIARIKEILVCKSTEAILERCNEQMIQDMLSNTEEFSLVLQKKEQWFHLAHFPLASLRLIIKQALQDPLICERIFVKLLQFTIFQLRLNERHPHLTQLEILNKILTDSNQFVSFIIDCLKYSNQLGGLNSDLNSTTWNILSSLFNNVSKRILISVNGISSESVVLMAPAMLAIAAKWLPENCVRQLIPSHLGNDLFKKICNEVMQFWTQSCPEIIPVFLNLGIHPDARSIKNQPTLLCRIMATRTQEAILFEGTAAFRTHTMWRYISTLLSYGANPSCNVIFQMDMGMGVGIVSLIEMLMKSASMSTYSWKGCSAHNIDIVLNLMQYGAKKTVTNRDGQNILEIIYEKYPGIKDYMRLQGIADKNLHHVGFVLNRINIACLRREIQYVSSVVRQQQGHYLNLLIMLANERNTNHSTKSILNRLPLDILLYILSYLDFDAMKKTPLEGYLLAKTVFSSHEKIKEMLRTFGGVSVFQRSDHPQFSFFKSANALAKDYYQVKSQVENKNKFHHSFSLLDTVKRKLKPQKTVPERQTTLILSKKNNLNQFEIFASAQIEYQLSFYKKPASKALLLTSVDDLPLEIHQRSRPH